MIDALNENDLETFFETLKAFFNSVPYDFQLKKGKYYQTIFYLVFQMLGLKIEAEYKTSRGRIDAVIETEKCFFIFEFKLHDSVESALDQIKEREYYQK